MTDHGNEHGHEENHQVSYTVGILFIAVLVTIAVIAFFN